MQRFFTSSSFFTFDFDLDFDRPEPPVYEGTLLPAVIHTFDFQVDIEEAETQRLNAVAQALEQELVTMTANGNLACTGLESERPGLVRRLTDLTAQLRALHAKIQDLDATCAGDKTETARVPGDSTPSSKQDRSLNEDQSKFKTATSVVKALHRKIMMLTHEERHGKNQILREIFDLANAARKNNDAGALEELLAAAKKYHQSAADRRNVLDFLKQRRRALANKIKEMQTRRMEIRQSAPYSVHTLLEQGRTEQALSVFTAILENARSHLQDQINIARMRLRHMQEAHKQKSGL
jgi:hypothetical protein